MKRLLETALADKIQSQNKREALKEGLEFIGGTEFKTAVNQYLSTMTEMINEANVSLMNNPTIGDLLTSIQKSKIIDKIIDLAGDQISINRPRD